MNLIETKYQQEFRAAPEIAWPGVGWFKQAGALNGTRAGNFTFVSVDGAGHGELPVTRVQLSERLMCSLNSSVQGPIKSVAGDTEEVAEKRVVLVSIMCYPYLSLGMYESTACA